MAALQQRGISENRPHQVVIVGGGFGGLCAARGLKRADCEVLLIDKRNFHLFQPLLYQVATGMLSPANIAAPVRTLVRKQQNTRVWMAEVGDIDAMAKRLTLAGGGSVPYDTLILAAGSTFNYFGHDEWSEEAPGLKTIEDATKIRARVLAAFEEAERIADPAEQQALLTFVIVGGGPTGVEMAGALSEVARHALRRDFRSINPSQAQIILVEAEPRVLASFPEKLSRNALDSLTRLGVQVKTGARVTHVHNGVTLQSSRGTSHIDCRNVLWTAGVKASPLGQALSRTIGAPLDRTGRVIVHPDLTVDGHPEIFVIGDLAHFTADQGRSLPGLAPVAMQEGRYVAKTICARLRKKPATKPFVYKDRGNLATIGRSAAVADFGWARFSGVLAWLLWLFVHLMYIVQFQNRVLIFFQWAWSYFTRNRAARLITQEPAPAGSDQRPAMHSALADSGEDGSAPGAAIEAWPSLSGQSRPR